MSIIVKSGVPGKVPLPNKLDWGQLALNYADEKIYFKNSSGSVVSFGGSTPGVISGYLINDIVPLAIGFDTAGYGDPWIYDVTKTYGVHLVDTSNAQTIGGTKTFNTRTSHAGAFTPAITVSFSTTPVFNCSSSNVFEFGALTANVTSVTLSNPTAGQTIQIRFVQDSTGGRTVATPTGAKIIGKLNATASRVSWLILTYSGTDTRWEGNWLQVPA